MGVIAAAAVGVAAAGASMGYAASQGEDVYGRKPIVPPYPSLKDTTREAIDTNSLNFDSIKALVGKTNQLNVQQHLKTLEAMYPGYSEMSKKSRDVIMSELGGELPKSVADELSRNAAERGIGMGSGSGFARNLEARDLGIASYNLTQQGLNSAARWMAQAANTTPIMRAESMFVTPAQAFQHAQDQFSRDWLAAEVAAAPDPTAVGQFNAIMTGIGQLGSAGSSLAGGMMGGGGMGGMGGMMGGMGGGGGGGYGAGGGFTMQQYGAINGTIGTAPQYGAVVGIPGY